MKVLLLTASYGDGHHQVASALADAFSQLDVETRELDCIRETRSPSRTRRVFGEWLYETITRYAPGLYGLSYNLTRTLRENHPLWQVLSLPLRRKLKRVLAQYQPEAVLQLFPERVLLDVKASGLGVWTGMVITDFSVHRRWFHAGVQAYFLPDEKLANEVQPYGHAGAMWVSSGIPLRRQFWVDSSDAPDDTRVHQEMVDVRCSRLPKDVQRPFILLAAGGRGLFPDLERTLGALVDALPDHNVYVMCGKSEQMRTHVEALARQFPLLHALAFVHDVAVWYQNASFAVVKAGGLTVSECLAVGCPMLLYRPQPGQEADNATFVAGIGAGRIATHGGQLTRELQAFADAPTRARMRQACARAAHPNAAPTVAQWVVTHVQEGKPR